MIDRARAERNFYILPRGIGAIIGLPLLGVAVLKVFIYKLMQHKGPTLLRHGNRSAPTFNARTSSHIYMHDGCRERSRGGPLTGERMEDVKPGLAQS